MSHRWPVERLGAVLRERRESPSDSDLQSGRVPIVEKISFHTGTIQFRTGGDTKTGMILVRPGDLVVSGINAAKGAIAVYDEAAPVPVAATIHYGAYSADQSRTDTNYIWWLLRSRYFQSLLLEYLPGGIKTELKAKRLLAIPVPIPPLAEQRRLVARIRELSGRIAAARNLRQSAEDEAKTLVSACRAAHLDAVARRFPIRPLGDLISMSSGQGLTSQQMSDAAPYPVYGGGGFSGRYSAYLFEEPTIVIGRVGARCGCVFVTEPKAWVTDNALCVTNIHADVDSSYLVHALTALDLRRQANQAAQPVVSQKRIHALGIPVPPLPEQRRIVRELAELTGAVNGLSAQQSGTAVELDALLPAILDRAFKGELV